ncbi:cation:proton antiporter [Teredinibacter waterburyi]|jgi:sodium/proton antiporter, CPA1 family (TC 2.A.36)|uniref:cation:proton antiporter n=1 Tax=Teredinibacter waterburyi TaxID=1500538 RepID=UPI001FE31E06|nr:sodium:proton antiporter [Teredinibacter waterburyi]
MIEFLHMDDPTIVLVAIGLLSIACQYIAYRLKLPAILPLLLIGLALGPGLDVLDPDALFGSLLFPMVSLAVAIILFEGALTLDFDDLGSHGSMVRNLCTLGAVITWLIVTPAAHFFIGFDWAISFLFGAIVTVTGPTVIVPMLRSVRPNSKISNILRWEGIIIDPIGALLAVLVFDFVIATQHPWSHAFLTFGKMLAVGLGVGLVSGFVLGYLLRGNFIPHYLRNTAVLTLMLGVFALSNLAAHESGLLTVTVMGIVLANMKDVDVDDILEFKETLSVLLISALFIMLAARLNVDEVAALGFGSAMVIVIIMFVARPVSVFLSAWKSDLKLNELIMLSWISPRGIVAAAVASLFALKLELAGFEQARLVVPMVFLVIISTVVFQSLTSVKIANLLGVRVGEPNGVLFFGANRFTRLLAKELLSKDIPVQIADTNWDAIREARMENIPTYYGNPISDHAARTLDISTVGKVLVVSPYKQLNPLVTYHFDYILGSGSALGLSTNDSTRSSHKVSMAYEKKLGLFAEGITYGKLVGMVAKSAVIKTTRLSDEFTMADYSETYGDRALALCAINPSGAVHIFSAGKTITAKSGWQIVSLIAPDKNESV